MIQFRAFVNNDPQRGIPDSLAQRWKRQEVFPQLGHEWTLHRNNVFMSVHGDCSLENNVYTSTRLDLICHADLLGSGSCDDFREANRRPAEYLARRYEQRGDDLAQDLRGWFGIVLYDYEQNTLKAWTDHFGVRRIVYRAAVGALAIASDLRLLNEFGNQVPEVDPAAILEYLQYSCIPAPRTIFRGCLRLEPGHYLTSKPVPKSHVYWDMSYPIGSGKTVRQWASETEEAIRRAVSIHTRVLGDSAKLGCFLSGGTDSSSVSGLVGELTGEPPRTFSIGFDHPRYNEMYYARAAARCFHADHHEYFVQPQDIVEPLLKAAESYDEPFGNSSIIPAYYCARMAREHGVTHMLAGDGGDELFGGNQRYSEDLVFRQYQRVPSWIRKRIVEPAVALPFRKHLKLADKAFRYVRRATTPVPERWHSYDFLFTVDSNEVFSDQFLEQVSGLDPISSSRRHYGSANTSSDLNRWLYLDLKITITDNDLRKVTLMTELAGAIPRYPLLDHVLAEFSGTIPPNLKVKGTCLRYIFKLAMSKLLPSEVIKKSKHGFGLPFSAWLAQYPQLREFTFDTLKSRAFEQRHYFSPGLIDMLWSKYQTEHAIFYGDILWLFLMLERWHIAQHGITVNNSA